MMTAGHFLTALVLISSGAQDQGQEQAPVPERDSAAIRAVQDGLVQVEYTLQYDKGESPRGAGWQERCPNCGRYHGSSSGSTLIEQERPHTMGGYLVSPTQVLVRDLPLHPRFIKSIHVKFAEKRVEARIARIALSQNARLLELAEPLSAAKPLSFEPFGKAPYRVVTHGQLNGVWTTTIRGMPSAFSVTADGATFVGLDRADLITTIEGHPVAVWLNEELPPDDSWKAPFESWSWVDDATMSQQLAKLETCAANGLLRVALTFRSPRKGSGGSGRFSRWSSDDDDEEGQEKNTVGVVYSPRQILILANLAPKLTARLERITVYPAAGESFAAKFVGSLEDYGAFVAELENPLPEAVIPFCNHEIRRYREEFLYNSDVVMQGKNRVAYHSHQRITGFSTKWKGRAYPLLEDAGENEFLFNHEREMVACFVVRRKKVASEEDRWSDDEKTLTPASYIGEVLNSLKDATDPGNVPLSEQEENRLAWLGVELQPLDRELARINGVSDLTRDGDIGALVSYVYPDSPAATGGIASGNILLRLHVDGQPKPLDVKLDSESGDLFDDGFPWEKLESLPAEYFEHLPTPWPSVESAFTRALTDLGFGKTFQIEYFSDGKTARQSFQIMQGPPHFGSASQYKSEILGLTVRDLTYEVRRYFQKSATDPGVIVAKIESGGKAAVAKILPYEIITQVNNQPVADVKAFEALVADQKELRISINRMNRGRIAKIKLGGKAQTADQAVKTPDKDVPSDNASPDPLPDDQAPVKKSDNDAMGRSSDNE